MKKYNQPGDIHFATFKTFDNYPYFKNEICFKLFLNILNKLRAGLNFKIFAFCILLDQVHLLIRPRVAANSFAAQDPATNKFVATREGDISHIIKAIKGASSREINKHLKTQGNFWQKDFYDFNIYTTKKFWRNLNIISQN